MPLTTSAPVITCDCCGYVVGSSGGAGLYTSVFRNLSNGTSAQVYLCNNKGCDAKVLAAITSGQTTEVARHTALIVGGVIPTHPA